MSVILSCWGKECYYAVVTNTGTTSDFLTFYDCADNINTITINSGETTYITYCSNYPVSGNTSGDLVLEYNDSVTSIYYFSSCCEDNQSFSILGDDEIINLQKINQDSIYGSKYFLSTGGTKDYKCSVVYGGMGTKTAPPVIGELISGIENFEILPTIGCSGCTEVYPCTKQCYGLLACDGSYPLLISSNPILSAYTNSFIYIDITSPINETPTTQFFVNDLGVVSCESEYEFSVVSTATTCDCNCYTFKTPSEPIITQYVNCSDNLFNGVLPTGQTFNFCAKTKPYFDYEGNIIVSNGGNCINNACPRKPITIKPRNECDVLTIFPMDVFCNVIHPSDTKTFDGVALLTITGGTPPYTIAWENGSVAQLISGLQPGEYSAVVSDFYNDFIITSTCVLTGATPTPTQTPLPTPTPLPIYGPICVRVRIRKDRFGSITTQTQFYQSEYINGYPSWTGNSGSALVYWVTGSTPNYWTVSGLTTTGTFVNTNPAIPPLVGWQSIGNPHILPNDIIVYSGICTSGDPITFEANAISAECGKDGRITITANGGVPSYQYSIDGGVTYSTSSVFNNLAPGTYYVRVKDSLGNESGVQSVTITLTPAPVYSLTMNVTQTSGGATFTITPSLNLPATETIQFDIVQISNLTYYPDPSTLFPVQPTPTYNNTVTFTNPIGLGGMTLITTQNQSTNFATPGCNGGTTQGVTQTSSYDKTLTISGGQTITGTITDQILNPITSSIKCTGTNSTYSLQITSARTQICPCCPVTVINPANVRPTGIGATVGGIVGRTRPPRI